MSLDMNVWRPLVPLLWTTAILEALKDPMTSSCVGPLPFICTRGSSPVYMLASQRVRSLPDG